jgi:hypothetical protein
MSMLSCTTGVIGPLAVSATAQCNYARWPVNHTTINARHKTPIDLTFIVRIILENSEDSKQWEAEGVTRGTIAAAFRASRDHACLQNE